MAASLSRRALTAVGVVTVVANGAFLCAAIASVFTKSFDSLTRFTALLFSPIGFIFGMPAVLLQPAINLGLGLGLIARAGFCRILLVAHQLLNAPLALYAAVLLTAFAAEGGPDAARAAERTMMLWIVSILLIYGFYVVYLFLPSTEQRFKASRGA